MLGLGLSLGYCLDGSVIHRISPCSGGYPPSCFGRADRIVKPSPWSNPHSSIYICGQKYTLEHVEYTNFAENTLLIIQFRAKRCPLIDLIHSWTITHPFLIDTMFGITKKYFFKTANIQKHENSIFAHPVYLGLINVRDTKQHFNIHVYT